MEISSDNQKDFRRDEKTEHTLNGLFLLFKKCYHNTEFSPFPVVCRSWSFVQRRRVLQPTLSAKPWAYWECSFTCLKMNVSEQTNRGKNIQVVGVMALWKGGGKDRKNTHMGEAVLSNTCFERMYLNPNQLFLRLTIFFFLPNPNSVFFFPKTNQVF